MLVVAGASASAFAHGTKSHAGSRHATPAHRGGHYHSAPRVRLGAFAWAPFWYYAPPLGYAPAVVSPSAPTVYIEHGDAASAPELPPGYWYYCAEAQAYYPDVKVCAGAWQPVAPQASENQ